MFVFFLSLFLRLQPKIQGNKSSISYLVQQISCFFPLYTKAAANAVLRLLFFFFFSCLFNPVEMITFVKHPVSLDGGVKGDEINAPDSLFLADIV